MMRWASRVGCRPEGERTNSASPKLLRSRASALLTVGCDIASWRPASVTEPVRCTAHSTRSRFRSSWRKFIDIGLVNGPDSDDQFDEVEFDG